MFVDFHERPYLFSMETEEEWMGGVKGRLEDETGGEDRGENVVGR